MRAIALLAAAVVAQGPSQPAQTADERFDANLSVTKSRIEELNAKIQLLKKEIENTGRIDRWGGGVAPVTITHVNDAGIFFTPESVLYVLDGATIYSKLGARGSAEVFSGNLPLGVHVLTVKAV